jgi:hypothetical protein
MEKLFLKYGRGLFEVERDYCGITNIIAIFIPLLTCHVYRSIFTT